MVDISQSRANLLNQRDHALRLLRGANQILITTRQFQPVLLYLLRETAAIIGAEASLLWLRDPTLPNTLACRASFPQLPAQRLTLHALRLGEGVAGRVAQTELSTLISQGSPDLHAPERAVLESAPVRSLIAVPLFEEQTLTGVLEVVNKKDGRFNAQDLAMAETLAASAATAISQARLVAELQDRNEHLDAFAHSVAHDLQNSLSRVVGFAELLQFKFGDLTEEDRLYAVNALSTNANKMSSIIQELLLLASVSKTDIAIEPLPMREIVSNALERLGHLFEEYQAELVLPEEWPAVLGYAPWIEEVWENYLSNALKYGGNPPRVELGSAIQSNGEVCFWVRDNGQGFDPDDKALLFVPLSKLRKRTRNGNENSYGLGLSIARSIVEKLGGEVAAECIQGQGSVFSFTLPSVKD